MDGKKSANEEARTLACADACAGVEDPADLRRKLEAFASTNAAFERAHLDGAPLAELDSLAVAASIAHEELTEVLTAAGIGAAPTPSIPGDSDAL